jgi:sulfide:quinone oxidoreductase
MKGHAYREVFACGDAAALTVPKLGTIGDLEGNVMGRKIAKDVGAMSADEADVDWMPEVICIGDMSGGKGLYINSNAWFRGETQDLQMGHVPYAQKIAYKELIFRRGGKMRDWGWPFSKWATETFKF